MSISPEMREKLALIAARRVLASAEDPAEKSANDEVGSEKEPAQSAPSFSTGTKASAPVPSTEKARRSERLSSIDKDSSRVKQAVVHPRWCQGPKCCAFNTWKGRCNHEKAGIEGFDGMSGCPEADVWARAS